MSLGIFKGSLAFICIRSLILTVSCASSAVTIDVAWEVKSPVVFGNEAYLQCNISDTASNCERKPRQWIGGPKYRSLCYENICTISNKYEVKKQTNCLYTLMIHNFSEQDVNCEYTCSYGVSRMRQNLTLDEKRFIYKPEVGNIKEEITKNGEILNWKINISKIFPKPSCGADLNGESITDKLQILVTKPGFYFTADLSIHLPLSSCGILDVYCYLRDYKINIISKNFDSCHLQGGYNNDRTVIMIVIIFLMLLVLTVFMIYIYRGRKMHFNNNDRRSSRYLTARR